MSKEFVKKKFEVNLGKGHGRWSGIPTKMKINTAEDSGGEYLFVHLTGPGVSPKHFYLSVEDAIELSFLFFDLYEDRIKKE